MGESLQHDTDNDNILDNILKTNARVARQNQKMASSDMFLLSSKPNVLMDHLSFSDSHPHCPLRVLLGHQIARPKRLLTTLGVLVLKLEGSAFALSSALKRCLFACRCLSSCCRLFSCHRLFACRRLFSCHRLLLAAVFCSDAVFLLAHCTSA